MTTPITTYMQCFVLIDSEGNPYKLRQEDITTMVFRYRVAGETSTDFSETFDFNIDRKNNFLWVRLKPETYDWYITINVSPQRCIQSVLTTTTFAIGKEKIECYATVKPVNSLQGFSPFINKTDNYWYEYDDEAGAYVNTYIKAVDTTGEGYPIVDYIQDGVMSSVTSNAVAGLKQGYDAQITNINNQVTNLNDKRIKVNVNGETYTEDDDNTIDLGTIATEAYNSATTRTLTKEETINDTIVPKGSLVRTTGYPNSEKEEVIALSSPHQFNELVANEDSWYKLYILNGGAKLEVKLSVYNNSYRGTIEVFRNGYTWNAVTTSRDLANEIKIYQIGVVAYLVVKGNSHLGISIDCELDGTLTWIGETTTLIESQLRDMDVFLTSETSDWATITASPYSVTAAGLTIVNYNVATASCDFTFSDELDYAVSLRFNAMQDGTIVNVSDSAATWTATCRELSAGEVAILNYSDSDAFEWSYTTQKDYEQVTNKVQEITSANSASTTSYASLYALTKWTEEHGGGGTTNAITSNTITSLEKPKGDEGIVAYYPRNSQTYSISWGFTPRIGDNDGEEWLAFDTESTVDPTGKKNWLFSRDYVGGKFYPIVTLSINDNETSVLRLRDIETIKVNGSSISYDETLKGFDLGTIGSDGTVKSATLNGTSITPDTDGNLALSSVCTSITLNNRTHTVADPGYLSLGNAVTDINFNGKTYTVNSNGVLDLETPAQRTDSTSYITCTSGATIPLSDINSYSLINLTVNGNNAVVTIPTGSTYSNVKLNVSMGENVMNFTLKYGTLTKHISMIGIYEVSWSSIALNCSLLSQTKPSYTRVNVDSDNGINNGYFLKHCVYAVSGASTFNIEIERGETYCFQLVNTATDGIAVTFNVYMDDGQSYETYTVNLEKSSYNYYTANSMGIMKMRTV